MPQILHIDSSLFSGEGVSSTLAARLIARWRAEQPGLQVTHRDLGREPIPHLDAVRLTAIQTPAEQRTPEQQAIAESADTLIRELQAADGLVLGVPMYNFGIPSPLKAWFDHVARAGVTFRYTEQGPQGLLTGKRAVILASRGGKHRGQPTDTQSSYLRTMLGFLGITDVEFVYAEALNLGEEPRRVSLAAAEADLERLPLARGGVS
ncbi:FMN-dependent NADH-azoreductase [Allochromatium palmeri]|uniref:FMN dependent NADH:quinone oxidoreductase n=1 Tax=Allochromatium palmeri TaxID=231048 RepID=A0A6N8EKH8_9GAMM|nr:FMN-dependent NADH-azoreductase [Allochromatium palmeri]MTW23057.1 FMN-dependent NADH-azoreductase [Allochromatium palmeri]